MSQFFLIETAVEPTRTLPADTADALLRAAVIAGYDPVGLVCDSLELGSATPSVIRRLPLKTRKRFAASGQASAVESPPPAGAVVATSERHSPVKPSWWGRLWQTFGRPSASRSPSPAASQRLQVTETDALPSDRQLAKATRHDLPAEWVERLTADWDRQPPQSGDLAFLPGADIPTLDQLARLIESRPTVALDWHVQIQNAAIAPSHANFSNQGRNEPSTSREISGDNPACRQHLKETLDRLTQAAEFQKIFFYATDRNGSRLLGRLGVSSFPTLAEPVDRAFSGRRREAVDAFRGTDAVTATRRILMADVSTPAQVQTAICLLHDFDAVDMVWRIEVGAAVKPDAIPSFASLKNVEIVSTPRTVTERAASLAGVDSVLVLTAESATSTRTQRAWPARYSEWFSAGVPMIVPAESNAGWMITEIDGRWHREQATRPGRPVLAIFGVPNTVVGRTYNDETELADAVADMLDHFEHYQRTAADVAPRYFAAHSAEQTVAQMIRRSCLARLRPSRAA